jgi:hypothetical protein
VFASSPEPSPAEQPAAPPPVDGLRREVEVMSDGRRRISYYSREAAAAPADRPEPGTGTSL